MSYRICFLLFVNLLANSQSNTATADEFGDIKLLREVPFGSFELRIAYNAAKQDGCEQVGEGQPLEMTSFTPYLTNKDKQTKGLRPMAASRKGFMSIGLEITESGLPALSKSKILEYANKNYVSLQARVRRDLLDRELYYHHRPIAVTGQYSGPKLSKAFEPVVTQTTSNIRSLGTFVEKDKRPLKAEHLRTIVLAFRFERQSFSGTAREQYELAIVRGKESADGLTLEPHTFVTQENSSQLVYLRGFKQPKTDRDCSIVGKVKIIEFDKTTGLYPQRSVTEDYRVDAKATFERSKLEEYCKESFGGSMSTHLNQLLDDIIDNKLPESMSASR